jgi:hypothetical protein
MEWRRQNWDGLEEGGAGHQTRLADEEAGKQRSEADLPGAHSPSSQWLGAV